MLSPDLQQALQLHRAGRFPEAESLYRAALAREPDHPAVPHLLGVLAAQTGRLQEAFALLRQASERQPRNPEVFNDLGGVAATLGRLSEAETALRQVLAMAPNHIGAQANLAKLLQQQGRHGEAESCAAAVLLAAPGRPDMVNVLALCHLAQRRLPEAEQTCRDGLARAPDDPNLHNTLGMILRKMHRLHEAAAAFEQAIAQQPKNPLLLYNIGVCHHQLDAHAAAEDCFRRALALQPDNGDARYALAESVICQGRSAEGRVMLDALIAAAPRHWMARWSRLLALPVVYESQAQLETVRADYDHQLAALERDVAAHLATDLPAMLKAARYKTPFLLHYQGYNEVALQRRFGGMVTTIARAAYPQHAQPIERRTRAPGTRRRIGFASSFFRSHSMSKTHGAWVTDLPRDRFEVILFHLNVESDATTERLKQDAVYHACGTLTEEELVARIARADLDALIWLDIGMEQKAQVPAALRLAPVQATTLGHPITTGFPAMDYFLSSELMEPADGESHYTERLIRLPNLSVCYPRPPAQAGTEPALLRDLKRDGRILYLCAQSLFKLVPANDALFAALARAVPQSAFLFISHAQAAATEVFRRRLHDAFVAAGVDPAGRIHILPQLSQGDFFALNRGADVVLDSLGWSGFNSTMEALACDRPVVTWPGHTMRARHAMGVLRMIGLDELIAADAAGYVARAARLGTDANWHSDIVERIATRKPRLFQDAAAVAGLAEWLDAAIAGEHGRA